jgi:hypothetical protein
MRDARAANAMHGHDPEVRAAETHGMTPEATDKTATTKVTAPAAAKMTSTTASAAVKCHRTSCHCGSSDRHSCDERNNLPPHSSEALAAAPYSFAPLH